MLRNASLTIAVALLPSFISFCAHAQEPADPADVPAEMFARLPRISGAKLSPDGSRLAFFSPVEGEGRNRLIIIGLVAGVDSVAVPPLDNLDFAWLQWANNDRLVFSMTFSATRNRVETVETRLLAIDRDGKNLKYIVKPSTRTELGSRLPTELPPAQLQDYVVDWLVTDPQHILLALDADHDNRNEVRLVDINNGDFKVVQNGVVGIQTWITDQRGELRFGYGYRGLGDDQLFRLKQPDGRWKADSMARWSWGDFFPVAFTDDPDVAYVMGRNESGRTAMRKLNLSGDGGFDTVYEHDNVDIGGLVTDPVTGSPAGVFFTEHLVVDHYFDETMAKLQRSVDRVLKNTGNQIVSMSEDRMRILVFASADTEPGTYYLWDRQAKTIDMIGEVQPGLGPAQLAPVEAVSYEAGDGAVIPAYLTVPLGAERRDLPTVVLPHGGPQSRDSKSYWFVSAFLASRGYAVLQPNFRGSTGYGHDFEDAGKKQWGGLMQDDVTDGAEWLIEQGIADPDRMCIVGWSYGGYSAAMGAVKTPELFSCAASINGVLDLATQISEDLEYLGGSVWTKHMGLDGEKAKAVSPYAQAERIQIPTLIIQAKDDARVTREQGRRMAKRLRKLGKPVEFVEIPFGGHSLTNEPARLTVLNSLASFLEAHIERDRQR